MLRSLILITFILPFQLLAQEFSFDDYLLKHHLNLSDSSICRIVLDSLGSSRYADESMWFYEWNFHQSEDGRLKVYQWIGESCGAYCNPMIESVVIKLDDELQEIETINSYDGLYFEIDSSFCLDEKGMYLLMGNSAGRPRGIEGVSCLNASLWSTTEEASEIWRFESCISSLIEIDIFECKLEFNKVTREINYTYTWYEEHEDFQTYGAKGLWKFDGKTFNLMFEEITYLDE